MSKLSYLPFDVTLLTGDKFCYKHTVREGNVLRFLKHPEGNHFELTGRQTFEKANIPVNRD
jgi:hypothetical protein